MNGEDYRMTGSVLCAGCGERIVVVEDGPVLSCSCGSTYEIVGRGVEAQLRAYQMSGSTLDATG